MADDSEMSKDGKGIDELSFEATAFESLERDFQEVLQMLVGDKTLEKFRFEYEKLHRALKKSHSQEKRLIKKCRELNSEIVNNAAKVQTALKLSQDDRNTITSLRVEVKKAWKMVDSSHEKELRAKETIQQLKVEISNLSRLVEEGAGLSQGQENTVKDLMKARDDFERKNVELKASNDGLGSKLQEIHIQLDKKNKSKDELSAKVEELEDVLATRNAKEEREARHKERMGKELKDLKTQLDAKNKVTDNLTLSLDVKDEQIGKLELQVKRDRTAMEKYLRDYDALVHRTQSLSAECDEKDHKRELLSAEILMLQNELSVKGDEVRKTREDVSSVKRHLERSKKRERELVQRVADERTIQDIVKREKLSISKELDVMLKREQDLNKTIQEKERETKIFQTSVQRQTATTKQVEERLSVAEAAIKQLESEIVNYKKEAISQRTLIIQLEKDRERYGLEAGEERLKYLEAVEELKLKEMHEAELYKNLAECDTKLKQQQQLYEAVRSEKNLYSKNMIECQDEIAEMKRKSKIMHHQIEQLKEEIQAKDHALVKEHFDRNKVEKHKDHAKQELSKRKQLLGEAETTLEKQHAEIGKLTHVISKMDEDMLRQHKEYDQVISERDILGTQLIRRNDELALLYEKIKIMQSTLRKGEAQYQERIQDIKMLKLKISDESRELTIFKHKCGQLTELKREVHHLQRELIQEKTKVKALSEELENPMNVHRWRKLEGSDPATYEMIQKIQTLQKRLIQKTEQVVEKDLLIQEKEKLYVELKNILARQPGPEVAEQLSVYQTSIKEKTRQMKAMASELNMYQAQINEFKYEIDRVSKELQDVKRKYYEQKRREQLNREMVAHEGTDKSMPPIAISVKNTSQAAAQAELARSANPRFAGGGFNITTKS